MELGGNGQDKYGIEVVILMIGFFVLVVLGVVLMTLGQRRIPTLSAKHVRGNRVYGGTKEYLPLRSINRASCRSSSPAACCSFRR